MYFYKEYKYFNKEMGIFVVSHEYAGGRPIEKSIP